MLIPIGQDRIRFARGDVREALYAACPHELRTRLHGRLLSGEEGADAYAAAWHATSAGSERRWTLRLEAMERAWAVSAYESALALGAAAFAEPGNNPAVDADLVLALLTYEAGEYKTSDARFEAALQAAHPAVDRELIRYLLGYNAVFGTGDYAKGIRVLTAVLEEYERRGDARTAAYVRNSIAFAHFQSKRPDDAMTAEETSIRETGSGLTLDSFLESILHLNLGRLYGHVGDLDGAIRIIQYGLTSTRDDQDTHILLLSYATLGSLQSATGRYADALGTYRHVAELARNMQLDGVKDQVVFALSKGAPHVPGDVMTRADEILFYLQFHLARLFQAVGPPHRARAARDAVVAIATEIGPAFGSVVTTVLDSPLLSAVHSHGAAALDGSRELLPSSCDLIVEVAGDEHLGDVLGQTLAEGGTVALLYEDAASTTATPFLQSVVVFDARNAETAERMSREFGGSYVQKAAAAVVLPEGLELFVPLMARAGIQQMTTVTHDGWTRLPGLVPVGLNLQIASEELDGALYSVLRAFAQRSGLPLLGVAPFHRWRGDLVTTPQQAVQDFLLSSVDRLCVAGRFFRKVHGSTAVQNIAKYRPRLSRDASVFENKGACLIQIDRKGGYGTGEVLKVHAQVRSIIDLCDGTRDVSALVTLLTRSSDLASPAAGRLASVLRGLWRSGALCFDPPIVASTTPSSVH